MKFFVEVDVNLGVVHSVTVTAVNTADIVKLPYLLRDEVQAILSYVLVDAMIEIPIYSALPKVSIC